MIIFLGWPVEPVAPVEPVGIRKTSNFIFFGQTGQQAQPKSCEHFNAVYNLDIGR